MDASDECILDTAEKNPANLQTGPFAYLFPLSAITVSKNWAEGVFQSAKAPLERAIGRL